METLKNKIWKEITHFGSIWFYSFIVVFVFILGEKILAIHLIISMALAYIITLIVREIYFKERPRKQEYNNFLEKFDASSFPSLHSIRAMILFTLFSFYYRNLLIVLLFLTLAIIIFASRYILKKHYLVDIVSGAIIGFLLSYGIILVF